MPDAADCLIGEVLLDPVWSPLERSLHVGVEQFLALNLKRGASLFVERLGDSHRPGGRDHSQNGQ